MKTLFPIFIGGHRLVLGLALVLLSSPGSRADLVGWWKFDETLGSSAADSSSGGTNHEGILENGAAFVPSGGRFGGSVALDGVDDIVRIADHDDFEFEASSSFTIAFWFKTTADFPNTRGFIGKGYETSPHTPGYYIIRSGSDEVPEFDSRETSSSTPRVMFDSSAADGELRDGNWHHIAVVRDVAAGQTRIYYDNGAPVSEALTGNGDWSMGVNSMDVIIGLYAGRWTEGEFDDVGIWKDQALTTAEVAEIFQSGIGGVAEVDTDGDGMNDDWERLHFNDSLAEDEFGDFDSDGMTNGEEHSVGTNPNDTDSDDDGLSDGAELNIHDTDPTKEDSDGDGLTDGDEALVHLTDPRLIDSDGDTLSDGDEVNSYSTKPLVPDSDDDGFSDGVEVAAGSDPNDPESKPDVTNLDDIVINEFMATNSAALLDGDGDSSDWIELWNPNASLPVDITGWHLTDDPADLTKWTFPGTILNANEFLVVFASGKDRAVGGSELHTSFSLEKNGGYLALTRPDGSGGTEIVHRYNPYGKQFEDVSYGLYGTTDPLPSGYFSNPTPNAANDASAVQGFVADTVFSVDRGFYTSGQTVGITCATPGASIIFTTDGTIPTESPSNGIRVDASDGMTPPLATVNISTTTQLRAMAVKAGFEPTNVDTHSYIFPSAVLQQSTPLQSFRSWGSPGSDWEMDSRIVDHSNAESRVVSDDLLEIPTISVSLPFDDMWGNAGIYSNANQTLEKFCSIEYLNPSGDPAEPNLEKGFQVEGTIQIVGGSSPRDWRSNKLSMRLKFSSSGFLGTDGQPLSDLRARPFDKDWIPFGKEATDRYDTLVLDARYNNVWGHSTSAQQERGQYVRDQYIADLQNVLGGTAPHGRSMHLYVAGLYWGLYTVHERPDEDFAAEYYGGDSKEYDVMKHKNTTVVSGSNANYLRLLFLANANLSSKSNYDAITEVLDVEDLARYMLVNYYGGNTDWAHHNWYASYNRRMPGAKWHFHSWDAEHVLEGNSDDSTPLEDNDDDQGPAIIHHGLMDNLEYKLIFADLVRKEFFNDGNLTPAKALEHYMKRLNIVNEAVRAESARWGDSKPVTGNPRSRGDDWLAELNRLTNSYFPQRTNTVFNQIKAQGWYPAADAPNFAKHGGDVADDFPLTITSPDGGTIYYTLDGSDPRQAFTSNPVGMAYSGPVVLTDTATVRARVLKSGEWSALTEAQFVVNAVEADSTNLTISEIHYRPASPSVQEIAAGFTDRGEFEFLELVNTSEEVVKLTNVLFTSGIDFDFGANSDIPELAPGVRLVIVENAAAFEMRYGSGFPIAGEFQNGTQLSNGGETLTLMNTSLSLGMQTIQSITYDDASPWPAAPDGDGFSLTLACSNSHPDATLPSNWRSSVAIGGSPGSDDGESLGDWLAGHGMSLGDELLDQDRDGLLTLSEYAMGTDPTQASPDERTTPSIVEILGVAYPTLSYFRSNSADDVTFHPEFSMDLDSWVPAAEAVSSEALGEGRDRITVRSMLPVEGNPRQFMRLGVQSK